MNSDSESYEKLGGGPSQDTLTQNSSEPTVLLLSGQSILDKGNSAPLYQLNSNIISISNKNSSVELERVEHDVPEREIKCENITEDTSRKRHIFYLVHPVNAQYRSDIPAKYYMTSAVPEMVGNIRLETSESRFQRKSFKAMLSPKRTASDKPLFDDNTQQLLFDIHPNRKVGCNSYKWGDASGRQVAVEEKENDRPMLSITTSISLELRDALVAVWLLRLWYEMAESKQAKREFFESMTSPEAYKENMDPYMSRQCVVM